MSAESSEQGSPCEWCGHPTDKPTKLCQRCRIIKAEETHIWGEIEGRRCR